MSTDNVLVITFGEDPSDDTNAYQALTDLKELDSQRQIGIAGAAVIHRDLDGRVDVKSEVGNDPYIGTASGGMIGLLLGIIGGPLGVLLGGAYGALVGSLFDVDDVESTESVLGEISKQIQTRSDGMLSFHVASLYSLLYRLEKRGWIKGQWVEKAGQRRRRYYKLTPEGRKVLAAQRSTWQNFVEAINRITGVEHA